MKIAYITGDISPNGNFTLFHDLLANYPVPHPEWNHKVYLVSPIWDRGLVNHLRQRGIYTTACFEEFQPSTDVFWEKIKRDTSDCDVIISGNITNLDEILSDKIEIPIVSLSLAEKGYINPSTSTYGSFYKPRFKKAAVSKAATLAFPEHVREGEEIEILYSGLDPSRLSQQNPREETREAWFPGRSDDMKFLLFSGTHQESKGLQTAINCLEYLSKEWHLIILTPLKVIKGVPEHLTTRVHLCPSTFHVADIYKSCDCFILPTEHEGLSMSLLECWYLGVPTVTTKHKAMLELMGKHQDTDFGQVLDLTTSPKEFAESIINASSSSSANQCVCQNYMANNMVDQWKTYLERICNVRE